MDKYLIALGVLSALVVFTTLFLVVSHYTGVYFAKHGEVHKQVKANEVFMIGFATFSTLSIMLGVWGLFYCWTELST